MLFSVEIHILTFYFKSLSYSRVTLTPAGEDGVATIAASPDLVDRLTIFARTVTTTMSPAQLEVYRVTFNRISGLAAVGETCSPGARAVQFTSAKAQGQVCGRDSEREFGVALR